MICSLPRELLRIILNYLTKTKDIINSILVCKLWYKINKAKSKNVRYVFDNIDDVKCINCYTKLAILENIYAEHPYTDNLYDSGYKFQKPPFDEEVICDKVTFYCDKCSNYYVACEKCLSNDKISFCKLLGFEYLDDEDFNFPIRPNHGKKEIEDSDYFMSDLESVIEDFPQKKVEYLDNNILEEYKCETSNCREWINHYVGDKNLFYYHQIGEYDISGPDGGFRHYWRCLQCNIIYNTSNK